jgi:predicted nucleic acid-binding protein
MPVYLADTSIWAWASTDSRPDITTKLAERFARDEVATCAPVVLETLQRAKTGAERDRLFDDLFAPIWWLPLTNEISDRAVAVQREMAHANNGMELCPALHYLVAAVAEAAGPQVVLWHLDEDLGLICEQTGQPHEAAPDTAGAPTG